jgi:hypothetical protein
MRKLILKLFKRDKFNKRESYKKEKTLAISGLSRF